MNTAEAAQLLPKIARSKRFRLVRLQPIDEEDSTSLVFLLRAVGTGSLIQVSAPNEWPPKLREELPT